MDAIYKKAMRAGSLVAWTNRERSLRRFGNSVEGWDPMAPWRDDLVLAACKTLGLKRQARQVAALCAATLQQLHKHRSARAVAVPVLPNWSFAAFVCMNKPYTVCTVCSSSQCSIGQ